MSPCIKTRLDLLQKTGRSDRRVNVDDVILLLIMPGRHIYLIIFCVRNGINREESIDYVEYQLRLAIHVRYDLSTAYVAV
jgi:hypothetical protein